MKAILSFALMLCAGLCLSAEPHMGFSFGEVPVVKEESNLVFQFADWQCRSYLQESNVDMSLGLENLTFIFPFTKLWWLKVNLERMEARRDEAADAARATYEIVYSEVMNDILWLGAPRELVILDEPE